MASQIDKRLHIGRGIRWVWAMGLGVPLLLGLVLTLAVVIALVSPRYEPADMISVGSLERFDVGSPVYFEEHRFWLVRLPSDRVLALRDVDPESSCPVPWHPGMEFKGERGWFRDACHGSVYDLEGKCFSGPCPRGLDRMVVLLQRSEVIVKVNEIDEGPPVNFHAEPVTVPREGG